MIKQVALRTSLVQWLRLHVSTAGGTGSIPDGGTKISQEKNKKQKRKQALSRTLNGHHTRFRKFLWLNGPHRFRVLHASLMSMSFSL